MIGCGGVESLAYEVDEEICRDTIQNTCTKCHGTARICKKLKDADIGESRWGKIIARMGRRAKISRDVQETVIACLTTLAEPDRVACD